MFLHKILVNLATRNNTKCTVSAYLDEILGKDKT